jgi:scyllo-inositol 2-dehydrogenase (NADP+)
MYKAAIIGLGKMGLSHLSIVNAHPEIQLRCVCDTSRYILDVLEKYAGVRTYTDFREMLKNEELDCVFIATPSKYHSEIVTAALDSNLHVFCEKPFALEPQAGYRLADIAERKGRVNQVGYHYRFVAPFNEAKRLLDRKLIGDLHHVRIEAYGPVVLRRKGSTWRSQKNEGGGCLFDYACHAIDVTNYLVGRPVGVSGAVLNSVFSNDVDDEIYCTFQFSQGFHGQLATNWSDESFRKMSLKLSFWGTNGRINVDRQEVQIYLRSVPEAAGNLVTGWNVRYTTELTSPVWFYVRGEEYSAQIDHFVKCINNASPANSNFRSASDAVLVTAMMRANAQQQYTPIESDAAGLLDAGNTSPPRRTGSLLQTLFGRSR